jgi:predicted enzyme related to lactoylglutathione lyase
MPRPRRSAATGGRDALPKFAVPDPCWHFIDPAGNTFGIFEVDPAAR